MTIAVRGGWVISFADRGHRLWREGVVVTEGPHIVHVGSEYTGRADHEIDARGKIVAPGLIDSHVHAGLRAAMRLLGDTGRRELQGQPFFEFIPRDGTHPWGEGAGDEDTVALFTVVELLRNGVTTFAEHGGDPALQAALVRVAGRLGIRAYLGPGFSSGRWVAHSNGRVAFVRDDATARRGLAEACQFIRSLDNLDSRRIRGLLCPHGTDDASLELLEATRRAADELDVPVQIHAAYGPREFQMVVAEQGLTPIEWLAERGLLRPRTGVAHANFTAESSVISYPGARDLEILAASGGTVLHCPLTLARRGRHLEWARYRKAGVQLALGSDSYPRDMFLQMRLASCIGKVVSRDLFAATAAEVFEAATLGGARALGREDLGRLAPGARADIIVINPARPGQVRWGPVHDPVRSIVECGAGDDVETVIVDGVIRMQDGLIPGVNFPELHRGVQRAADEFWAHMSEWDVLGRGAAEICPWSFPLMADAQ